MRIYIRRKYNLYFLKERKRILSITWDSPCVRISNDRYIQLNGKEWEKIRIILGSGIIKCCKGLFYYLVMGEMIRR